MKIRDLQMLLTWIVFIVASNQATAQYGVFTREDIITFTQEWVGERLPDGRPKVPDEIMKRMKNVVFEEAWAAMVRHGYANQFEGDWQTTHDRPVLVGRALTAKYMPYRPDVQKINMTRGEHDGMVGNFQSLAISVMEPGDVFVADTMGRIVDAPIFGDNLANAILFHGGRGAVFNGSSRDLEGLRKSLPDDFEVFAKGWDPSFNRVEGAMGMMGMGINCPISIGRAIVMPGDIVLAKDTGVIFIPAHLAEEVVDTSEIIQIRDRFGHQRLREGTYTPGQIDAVWTDAIMKDFEQWMKGQGSAITPRQRKLLLEGRTF